MLTRVVLVTILTIGSLMCCGALDGNAATGPCHGKTELPKVDLSKHCSQNYTVDYGVNIVPTSLSFSVLQTCLNLDLSKHCSQNYTVDYGVNIVPTSLSFSVLKTCLNCSLILRAPVSDQLSATFFSLGTETSPGAGCTENRLDIYDGDTVDDDKRLSNSTGICGCEMPKARAYKSSHNVMLLHWFTACTNETMHGEFELVVAAVTNDNYNKTDCRGQFECSDSQCIDKSLVCNGHRDCPDASDERNCSSASNSTCPGEFECLTGECIDKNLVCNGKNDCPDKSDEINCTRHGGKCPGKFECTDGQCIDKNLVCNGKNDCKDKSDEKDCKKKSHVLLYALIGLAVVVLILFVAILIVLCYKYCCSSWRMAAAYRRI